ncbi:MAG: hypothetical protein D6746_16510 [Bacteroidetes bacterium]|nr:MAG: hypothetical protein D6746_16510 [Bacteroidota bacterium]
MLLGDGPNYKSRFFRQSLKRGTSSRFIFFCYFFCVFFCAPDTSYAGARIVFHAGDDGPATALTLYQAGREIKAPRIE